MSLSCNEHDVVCVIIYGNKHRRLTTVLPIQALQIVLNLRDWLEHDKSLRFYSHLRMVTLHQGPL
jgi:hypothetical protein